jgi:hypothetical protein
LAFRIWVLGWNDGGTFRLGAFRASNSPSLGLVSLYPLPDAGVASSSLANSSATAAGVHYTGVAVANKAYRILGYIEWGPSGLASPGTWTITNLYETKTYGPGVPRPGSVVGGGGAYIAGNNAPVTFNTMSPANPIRLESAYSGGGAVSTNLSFHLNRGSTGLLTATSFEATANAVQTLPSGPFWDFPNQLPGGITYTAANVSFTTIGYSCVEAQEIMG